jgi:hypothetical protein
MMRRHSCIHTLLQLLILVALPFGISQAESEVFWNTNPYAWSAHSVTQSGRVCVTITKQKPKLFLARTHRPVVRALSDDHDDDYYDEAPEFQVGYRRPELVNQSADVELSDEIKLRLLLARKRALQAYHATWS